MTREDFDKMVLNRPGRSKLEREKFLAVGEACKAIFWPSLGFKREIFCWLWALSRGDLNFCTHSSTPPWGYTREHIHV